ncbi:hypothetical protein [Sphingomonas sp.]|uniref:hypothetical protein n=1 Tax=Sphingomonas sp. TaxID=28214 RepID=UPI003B0055B2
MARWLDAVQSGAATMSQRKLSSIVANGGIEQAIAAARRREVHLVELIDDKGAALVAASKHPFQTLC